MTSAIESSGGQATNKPSNASTEDRIYLISYPKIIFLYPTYIVALVCTIWMALTQGSGGPNPENNSAVLAAWIFLAALGTNLIVFSFDFPRGAWLTLVFVLVALVLGVILLSMYYPHLLPAVGKFLSSIRPIASASFYAVIVVLMTIVYIFVWIGTRFDYWEVRPNELLHHHGIMADLERFPAPNLRVTKEINDVFEFLLLGAGRLVLRPSGEQRPIILENIPFISKKEQAITRMLGALQVRVRSGDE